MGAGGAEAWQIPLVALCVVVSMLSLIGFLMLLKRLYVLLSRICCCCRRKRNQRRRQQNRRQRRRRGQRGGDGPEPDDVEAGDGEREEGDEDVPESNEEAAEVDAHEKRTSRKPLLNLYVFYVLVFSALLLTIFTNF